MRRNPDATCSNCPNFQRSELSENYGYCQFKLPGIFHFMQDTRADSWCNFHPQYETKESPNARAACFPASVDGERMSDDDFRRAEHFNTHGGWTEKLTTEARRARAAELHERTLRLAAEETIEILEITRDDLHIRIRELEADRDALRAENTAMRERIDAAGRIAEAKAEGETSHAFWIADGMNLSRADFRAALGFDSAILAPQPAEQQKAEEACETCVDGWVNLVEGKVCPTCEGSGEVADMDRVGEFKGYPKLCTDCGGSGKPIRKCAVCNGTGRKGGAK